MFHSAFLKLTLWYLVLIMVLSICFSVALYRVSANELDQNLRRQTTLLRGIPFGIAPEIDQINQQRTQQVEDSKERVLLNLIDFNLVVLLFGGAVSYFLAKRTLQPIEEALEAQNRFTADASHELRTPLTAMKTELEVSLRDERLTLAESKALLKSNLEEVEHLEALSGSLLKLAVQNGKLDKSLVKKCSLQEIVVGAKSRVQMVAKQRKIKLVVAIQEGNLEGDQLSLVELLTILLDNAMKYSPKESEVWVAAHTDSHHAYFSVKDQGIGIKASDLPHIFDRFYRTDLSRSKDKVEGYGLGLSIAKKIADLHHGRIEVESTPGKGSTFIVRLPLNQGT